MSTTVTLTADEMAYILEALRHRLADANECQWRAEDAGDFVAATKALVDVENVRAVRRRLADERQAQSGLAGRSLIGPAR